MKLFQSFILAFSKFPSLEGSPEAAAKKYRSRSAVQVRGNVFARLNGSLSESERAKYLAESHKIDELEKLLKLG